MGIFNRIKKYFSKTIVIDTKSIKDLVIPYKFKGGNLKVGTPLSVSPNFVFCLTNKEKLLDYFIQGEYTLDYAVLKECNKRFKIAKPQKDGSFIKKFKVNAYYISLLPFLDEWKTYRSMEFLDKNNFFYKAKACGVCSYYVKDTQKFLQSLLLEFAYIKNGEAERIVHSWISEFVTNKIERLNPSVSKLKEKTSLENEVYLAMAKKFASYGIMIEDFEIINVSIPKKYENADLVPLITVTDEKIQSTKLKEQEILSVWENEFDTQTQIQEDPINEKQKDLINEKQNYENIISNNSFNPFGENNYIGNVYKNNIHSENVPNYIEEEPKKVQESSWLGIEEVVKSLDELNNVKEKEEIKKEKSSQFVDLSLNSLYDNDNN